MEQLLKQIMEQMNKRFDSMDQQFVGVNQRLDRVEENIHSLENTVNNHASEYRSHFRHIGSKLDRHENMLGIIGEVIKFPPYEYKPSTNKE
ncbi:hypothetical protein BABA_01800 [Neobacillus bataviensis LMG 21833]|uniref:t-SNARE coiled-coil homology domain-containing protein n=1 Tax=Neobacillus bataviensis LMG 21833 TaxID=1117379 RepID=K6ED38_9BACI|nr:hypothetical protein [Neobacillus bataviensis]EKN71376.1 hypothetical protein BABA_01800 [Neobacillus bataviensis LMG 21833]